MVCFESIICCDKQSTSLNPFQFFVLISTLENKTNNGFTNQFVRKLRIINEDQYTCFFFLYSCAIGNNWVKVLVRWFQIKMHCGTYAQNLVKYLTLIFASSRATQNSSNTKPSINPIFFPVIFRQLNWLGFPSFVINTPTNFLENALLKWKVRARA